MHRLANYYIQGPRSFFRLLDKGGRSKAVSAHHSAQEYVDACLEAARIGETRRGPLFRSCEPGRHGTLQSLKAWSLRETSRYGSRPQRKTFDYGKEPIVVHTPASLAHELKAEARKDLMIGDRIAANVWELGRIPE